MKPGPRAGSQNTWIKRWESQIPSHVSRYLTPRQERKMATRPDMIVQFADYLVERWMSEYNVNGLEVRVDSRVSLNGRAPQTLIDPRIDLAGIRDGLRHAEWILPLQQPLDRSPETYRQYYRRYY